MASLTDFEVRELLEKTDSTHVIDAMYDMGKMLMAECGQRIDYLDAKSARISGYIGAMVGLMISTFSLWTSAIGGWAVFTAAAGILTGVVGAILAVRSMWPAKIFLPSDSDWLESDALGDADRLKKYYVSSIHVFIRSQEAIGARKVSAIKRSQFCLALMALALFFAFANGIYRVAMKSSLPPSGREASTVSAPADLR